MIDLKKLYWDGIAPAGRWSGIEDFRTYLSMRPQYIGHVPAKSSFQLAPEGTFAPSSSYLMGHVLGAPGFFALATSFLPVAAEYLGTEPKLYSVNAFWTRPTDQSPNPDIQVWHRDRDDERFLVLFMYGTDVLNVMTDGAHHFVEGSHRNNDHQHRAPTDDECVATMSGEAGTMFLADTSGLHFGAIPTRQERMLAWARYGVSNPPESYKWDGLKPVPASSLDLGIVAEDVKHMTRLVVDWEK